MEETKDGPFPVDSPSTPEPAAPVPAAPAPAEPAFVAAPAPPPTAPPEPPVAARPEPPPPPPSASRGAPPRPDRERGPRPELVEVKEPVYREAGAYRLRLDPPDLARLRELPGSKDKTERELGEQFFDAQAARLVDSIAGDIPAASEIRVVVDPYSRQAFLAVGRTIRGIVSF